ncbi:MAG: hemolysin III family protein [Acidimicrobiia bacterium]|nr:hemolysin III family protein [Acidimicrobiia bacterium]MBT8249987.1 hemolysin III family protein [Acidimicrobiia bacterium]NNC43126.1 hemolysin III family protein [Acidimicrobiia bacterium]NND14599.1 hemolysin III family protein [Acidimicrobiia bacterium]NNL28156.1 hemolysin III family protein [Acidimicrobiia bacterium]
MDRLTLGKMQNPVRGILHGSAAVASLIGLIVLTIRTSSDAIRMWSMVIFGFSLVALYTTSSLYHSYPWREKWERRIQRVDHSMILVLVAGSWTPIAMNVLDGGWRIFTMSVVWGLALIGVVQKILFPSVRQWFTVALATTMGWFAVVPLPQIIQRMSRGAIILLLVGGVLYTIGMVIYATRWPKLFPRVFSSHEVFHVLVVAGSAVHFALVYNYVVPY